MVTGAGILAAAAGGDPQIAESKVTSTKQQSQKSAKMICVFYYLNELHIMCVISGCGDGWV